MADDVNPVPPGPTVASVNQRVPPGPAVIFASRLTNPLRLAGSGISMMVLGLVGSSIPSLFLGMSVNQSTGLPLASGPTVIARGLASESRPWEYAVMVWFGSVVILPIAWKPAKLLD